jgi:CIC family chloride channel protein
MEEGTGIGNPVVGEVMDRRSDIADPDMTIADAVYGHLLHNGTRALPVCRYGRLIGIFTLADIEGTPREEWGSLTVMDRMTPVPLLSLEPDDDLGRAVDLLAEHSLNQAPVVEGDRLVGMLDRADIIQHLHHSKQRRVPRWPRSPGDISR